MKDEKKVNTTEEEAKKEVQTEENGVELTDEQLSEVSGGTENAYNKETANAIQITTSVTDSK